MPRTTKHLFRLHLLLLLVTSTNWLVEVLTAYGLNSMLEAVVESLLILSGLLLFFLKLRQSKRVDPYFSLYPLWTLLVSLGFIFKRSFGAIILYFLLHSIWPNGLEAQKGTIRIYTNAQGFMAMCCPYRVTEERFFILEKEIGTFQLYETFDPKRVHIENLEDKVLLTFSNYAETETIEIEKQ